jgi:hypothetical protein
MAYDNEKKVSMWFKKTMTGIFLLNGITYNINVSECDKKNESSPDFFGYITNKDYKYKISLWYKSSKGYNYFTGLTEIDKIQYSITIFENKNKKSEKSPDYTGEIKDKNMTARKEVQNQKYDNPFAENKPELFPKQQSSYSPDNMKVDFTDDSDIPF